MSFYAPVKPCPQWRSHVWRMHAHVRFNDGSVVSGDEVLVQGPPVLAVWGEVISA